MTELNTNILAIAPQLGLLLLVLGLGTVAYWREDSWLYLIAGLAICFYGIAFVATNIPIATLTVILGIYTVVRAFLTHAWR